MLKIKDDVDLKELEKFGFKKDELQMLSSYKKDYVYCFDSYEYICVSEPQGRGAWHCHVIYIFNCNNPYISNAKLSDIWGNGFVKVNKIKNNVYNVGHYLTAYLTDVSVEDINDYNTLKTIDTRDIKDIAPFGDKMSLAEVSEKTLVDAFKSAISTTCTSYGHKPGLLAVS